MISLQGKSGPAILEEIEARLRAMTPEQRAAHDKMVMEATAGMKFIPSPGPQTEAFHSLADILLYGGQAGGGKSALGIGLALTKHKRALILRRQYTDLSGLTEEAIKLNGTRTGYNGSIPPTLKTNDGRLIEFGACQYEGDEQNWMGRPHDLIVADEAWQFLEKQIRFFIGWLRTTEQNQRTRVILATNPPLSSEGDWLVKMFAPWLDPGHKNPALPGELRWFLTDDDGNDVEVETGKPYILSLKGWEEANEQEIAQHAISPIGVTRPMSRTFIPASVKDNPFLAKTDYATRLDSLRPELRASLRDGNFMANRKDDEFQVIPTKWLTAAVKRWTPRRPEGIPMCAIGVDPSGGGADPTAIAPRFDGWFDIITEIPGKQTPNGEGISGHVLRLRENFADVGLDMGGGYGSLPYKELTRNSIDVYAHKGSEGSSARSRDGIYGFYNKRSQVIWQFMEALDPNQAGGSPVHLPDDPVLIAELSAPRYTLVTLNGRSVIKVETKEEVKERLGRSPNRADAVQIAWATGKRGANMQGGWDGQNSRGSQPKVNMGHDQQRRRRY